MPPASRPRASIFWAWRSSSSRRFRCVMSAMMPIVPVTRPSAPTRGATESTTSTRVPSFRWRWVSKPATGSPRAERSKRLRYSDLLSSGTMGYGRPSTSRSVQPNVRAAAGFHVLTLFCVSSSMIASGEASISARRLSLVSRNVSSTRFCSSRRRRSSSVRSRTRCSSSSRAARTLASARLRSSTSTDSSATRSRFSKASMSARTIAWCMRQALKPRPPPNITPRVATPSPVDSPWRRKRAVIGNSVGMVKARNAAIAGARTGTEAMATPARTRARNICRGTDTSEKNRMPAAPQPRPAAAAPATKRQYQAATSTASEGSRWNPRTISARAATTLNT